MPGIHQRKRDPTSQVKEEEKTMNLELDSIYYDLGVVYKKSFLNFKRQLCVDHEITSEPASKLMPLLEDMFSQARDWFTISNIMLYHLCKAADVPNLIIWGDLCDEIKTSYEKNMSSNTCGRENFICSILKDISEEVEILYQEHPFQTRMIFAHLMFRFFPFCVYLFEPTLQDQNALDWILKSIKKSMDPIRRDTLLNEFDNDDE